MIKYCELLSIIVNSGVSIDRDTKIAVSLSPNIHVVLYGYWHVANLYIYQYLYHTTTH